MRENEFKAFKGGIRFADAPVCARSQVAHNKVMGTERDGSPSPLFSSRIFAEPNHGGGTPRECP